MAVRIGDNIAPTSDLDSYATHFEEYGQGSFRTVADLTERDAISVQRRKIGMLVRVLSESKFYALIGGITNAHWVEEGFGGSDVTKLPDLTDVDDALTYDSGFVFQADGSQYTGKILSHLILDDIGGLTHDDLDAHVNSDTTVHALATNLLHTTGDETKSSGILTFVVLPQSSAIPLVDNDLVNKAYADSLKLSQPARTACRVLTTTVLPDCTYDNGTDGVGATLTGDANGALSAQDGVTLIVDDRLLVKNQASALQNGIFKVTQVGDVGTPFILTRTTDYDQASNSEVANGSFTPITAGDTEANTVWMLVTTGTIVIGTSALVFTKLSAQPIYTASGEGIELVDFEFDLELDGATLSKSASGLKLAVDFGTANQILGMDAAATAHEYKSLTAGSNISITHTAGDIEIASSLSGALDYTYAEYTLHSHPTSNFIWANLPLILTAGSSYLRVKVNLTGAVEYRIKVNQAVAGFAGSMFRLRYSTNNSTFYDIGDEDNVGDLAVGTGTGVKVGTPEDIVAGAKQDVWLQLYAYNGDGIADPAWRQIAIEIKYNSTIVDGSSSDVVYKEVTVHAHSTSNSIWANMPAILTEFAGSALASRRKVNLTNCTHYRLVVNQAVAGNAGADLNLQYSLNGSSFIAADTAGAGELDVGTGTGVKYGAWAPLADGAKTDVWLRLVGKEGDGIFDPSWRYIAMQFKEYTFGPGGTDNHSELNELNWADAGHTFDADLDIEDNAFIQSDIGAGEVVTPGPDSMKMYVRAVGTTPNRTVTVYIKNEEGIEVVITSIIV